MLILTYSDYAAPARALAQALAAPLALVQVHRFPDGECKVQLPAPCPGTVVVCRSLDHPDAKLIELLLTARTARALGAKQLILVAPYLCYMRQDMAFAPGEAVSQRIVGEFLAGLFDTVIAVDPHLHRVHELKDAVPATHAIALSAAPLMGLFLRARLADAILLGPDEESAQWVQTVAQQAGWDFAVARKTRSGDRRVAIQLPDIAFRKRNIVLVDDMVSTGHTLAQTARQLKAAGARHIYSAITHALFSHQASRLMRDAGIETLWCSDSIVHACGEIHLAPLLAEAVAASMSPATPRDNSKSSPH
ncbi:MAG: ribose-phosphate diphosphokinase [Gammaproteobacteria bacterium]|nr:ribose-phosphate diphosphokinase [Gammaproteobacteria bacterium]